MKAFRNKNMMQGTIIRNPKPINLQFDTSDEFENDNEDQVFEKSGADEGDEIKQQNQIRKNQRLEVILNHKIAEEARLGVLFQQEYLIDNLPKKEQLIATKRDRLDKWYNMITYGLDQEVAHKVIKEGPRSSNISTKPRSEYFEAQETLAFTNYAKIGLQNYFNMNPE